MKDVGSIAAQRDRHADRDRDRCAHPTLRWCAGETFYIAHRRNGLTAVCGAAGDLMLAPPGVPRCVVCWPPEDQTG